MDLDARWYPRDSVLLASTNTCPARWPTSQFYVGSMDDDDISMPPRSSVAYSLARQSHLSDIIPHTVQPSSIKPSSSHLSYFYFHRPPSYIVLPSTRHIPTGTHHLDYWTFFEISSTFVFSRFFNFSSCQAFKLHTLVETHASSELAKH